MPAPAHWLTALVFAITLLLPSQLTAQSAPSPFTSGARYDLQRRVVGTIAPDPDGAGPLLYAAVRNTYDDAGRLVKVESGQLSSWKSETVAPSAWGAAFTVFRTLDTAYDGMDRKVKETLTGSDGVKTVTQYSYDNVGRLECTAVRMNPTVYGSLPSSACTLSTAGANGPDRITRNVYDAAGQLTQLRDGVGSTLERAQATYSYTANGKKDYVIDANGNRARLTYDGHDRLYQWQFPSTTMPSSYDDATQAQALSTAGSVNSSDYEQYGYDAAGNRTSFRKRDGSTLTYSYDALDRMSVKTVPSRAGLTATQTRDVFYAYNARGSMTEARFDSLSGPGVSNSYNDLDQLVSTTDTTAGAARTLSFLYDEDGNRTRITHSDNNAFTYAYDGIERLTNIYQGTGTTTKLETFSYSADSTLASRSEGTGGSSASFTWDGIGRLTAQADTIGGTGNNVSWSISRNPASQVTSETRTDTSNAYAYPAIATTSRPYVANGLNQYASVASNSYTYDANGNLTSDGGNSYTYDIENRLVKAVAGSTTTNLLYDPLGRLVEIDQGTAATTRRMLYGGEAMVAEYDSGDNLTYRYVHGSNAAADDPLAGYSGSGLTSRYYFHADRLGSIIAITNANGSGLVRNAYDEYGVPAPNNTGRFQYTGQMWLPELGMYYYKSRIYAPWLGRFMQVDTIGYDGGMNFYAYVDDDPVNNIDPTGNETGSFSNGGDPTRDGNPLFAEDVAYYLEGISDFFNSQPELGGPLSGSLFKGAAIIVRADAAAARAARLTANIAKGARGEAATAKRLGSGVAGERVTLESTKGTRTSADFVTKNKAVIESKNGPRARLSQGQRDVRADIRAGRDVIPRGANAERAGLRPNEPTPMKCYIVHRTNC